MASRQGGTGDAPFDAAFFAERDLETLRDADREVRMRCLTLTPKEKQDLLTREDCLDFRAEALDDFGKSTVDHVFMAWVQQMMCEKEVSDQPGHVVKTDSPAFSCCKSLMVARRALELERPDADCFCLNQVYFQPSGCACLRGRPMSRIPLFPMDKCTECSLCLRCGGLLSLR